LETTHHTQSCVDDIIVRSPFGGIPRNWKREGGGRFCGLPLPHCSPFGGIPRNWKRECTTDSYTFTSTGSPFGGIPRNWKQVARCSRFANTISCSPFGGIPRNWKREEHSAYVVEYAPRSPFGGIPRNWKLSDTPIQNRFSNVPPSGGSLEIGNVTFRTAIADNPGTFPLRGDP